jgi:hypothetical protein
MTAPHSPTRSTRRFAGVLPFSLLLAAAAAVQAQTVAPAAAPASAEPVPAMAADAGPLTPLAWLAGCWRGSVNQRDFREQWMPLRGGMMVGVGHTVMAGKTQSFEYLRLEPRSGDVYYVAGPGGKAETAFKLSGQTRDGTDEVFTFTNPANPFPQTIIYRRGSIGWLYAHVEGVVNSAEQKVIYPMRRVDCESGENIEK